MAKKLLGGVAQIFGGKKKAAAKAETPTSGPIVKQLADTDPLAMRARNRKPGLGTFPDVYRSTILERADRLGASGKLGA